MTLARALTDTFAGIRSADVPGFLAAQVAGAAAAAAMFAWLLPAHPAVEAKAEAKLELVE